jgi:hypothetical protein
MQHLVDAFNIFKWKASFTAALFKETGDESNNKEGRYEGSSELKMLTGYYISCKYNENIVKAGIVLKGEHK